MKSSAERCLPVLLIVLIPLVVVNIAWWAAKYTSMDLTSGVWAALAMDASDGVF